MQNDEHFANGTEDPLDFTGQTLSGSSGEDLFDSGKVDLLVGLDHDEQLMIVIAMGNSLYRYRVTRTVLSSGN